MDKLRGSIELSEGATYSVEFERLEGVDQDGMTVYRYIAPNTWHPTLLRSISIDVLPGRSRAEVAFPEVDQ